MLKHLHLLLVLAAPPQFPPVREAPPQFPPVQAAPVVAAQTFRGPVYNASHQCPTCGRSQFVIHSGFKGGTHTHRCPYDGTVWQH